MAITVVQKKKKHICELRWYSATKPQQPLCTHFTSQPEEDEIYRVYKGSILRAIREAKCVIPPLLVVKLQFLVGRACDIHLHVLILFPLM